MGYIKEIRALFSPSIKKHRNLHKPLHTIIKSSITPLPSTESDIKPHRNPPPTKTLLPLLAASTSLVTTTAVPTASSAHTTTSYSPKNDPSLSTPPPWRPAPPPPSSPSAPTATPAQASPPPTSPRSPGKCKATTRTTAHTYLPAFSWTTSTYGSARKGVYNNYM